MNGGAHAGRHPGDPVVLWHEAHPGVVGSSLRACHHRVARSTKLFLFVVEACGGGGHELYPATIRIRRDELATGLGVDATVFDPDLDDTGRVTAWFFAGPVPRWPLRPPGWLRERRKAVRREKKATKTRARPRQPVEPTPWPTRDRARAADLALLGLKRLPTAEALKEAWRATAKRTHPDAGGSQTAFVAVKAAYERLQKCVAA